MNNNDMGESSLGSLVKGEMAAVETYKQALEKVGDEDGGDDLRRIESEHEDAVRVLSERLEELAVEPPKDSGIWGDWSKAVEGTAKLFGNKAAIKALKEGEEHGVHEYEDALRDDSIDDDVKRLIRSDLLPKTKSHVPVLDRLLEASGSGR